MNTRRARRYCEQIGCVPRRKDGMEINIDKSQVMIVFKKNKSLQIKAGNRELKKNLIILNTFEVH